MKTVSTQLTGHERTFGEDEILVSKTNPKGVITYTNHVFCRVSGYSEEELLGRPHSIIRHPSMPRCVFELLWKTIEGGREIFAYVVNLSKNGDHYWVFAHVTPTFGAARQITGYHSNRRKPAKRGIEVFSVIYRQLLTEEQRHSDWREGMDAATRMLQQTLADRNVTYDEFVFSA